jgi:fibro-slime domain-containing protein
VSTLATAGILLVLGCSREDNKVSGASTRGSGGTAGSQVAAGGRAGSGIGAGGFSIGVAGMGGTRKTGGAGSTTEEPACGDGVVNQSEERCDDGNRVSGDGCSSECRIEADYLCATPGERCISTKVCGDAQLVGSETCDDGNAESGDGCSSTCTIEQGYRCSLLGAPCSEICGDSLVVGRESCDDGDAVSGDGCSIECQIERDVTTGTNGRPGYWQCPVPGAPCSRATCGNGTKEGAERCDDGNDRPADGCSPDCELEPQCSANGCISKCGDGIILPGESEKCDDGNSLDGDGCSASCTPEAGYECQSVAGELPSKILIPIVYRDFVGDQRALAGAPVHPDFESTRGASGATVGLVEDTLNASGVPVLTGLCVGAPVNGLLTGATDSACPRGSLYGSSDTYGFNQMSSASAFAQWYADVPEVNRTIVSRLCLARQGATDSYVFDSKTQNPTDCGPAANCADGTCWFLPINERGFVAEGLEMSNLGVPDVIFGSKDPASLKGNFSFTSVVRTWFIFRGGEKLDFSGDDDVWVFVNGHLAVDIGGLHSIATGGITLDSTRAPSLGLTAGRVYEVILFHAERYGYGSNFKLTLTGFATASSRCTAVCGDGIRAGQEACDNGDQNVAAGTSNAYGRCTDNCELGPRCGDGVVQREAGEACDEPSAQMTYTAEPGTGCTPACKRPGYCGDGVLQTGFEQCDDGDANSPSADAYSGCSADCHLGPHCGDGLVNGNEECDEGANNGQGSCGIGCRVRLL